MPRISAILRTKTTRRTLVLGPISVAIGATYSRYVEPRWLEVTRTSVPLVTDRRPSNPIRILHLADLHLSRFAPLPLLEEAFDAGLAFQPHLACITGDFVSSHEAYDRDSYREALRRLAQTLPVYACLGNHDGGVWAMTRKGHRNCWVIGQLLEESGIRVLHNRFEVVETWFPVCKSAMSGTPRRSPARSWMGCCGRLFASSADYLEQRPGGSHEDAILVRSRALLVCTKEKCAMVWLQGWREHHRLGLALSEVHHGGIGGGKIRSSYPETGGPDAAADPEPHAPEGMPDLRSFTPTSGRWPPPAIWNTAPN